jgi:hypothetical protein
MRGGRLAGIGLAAATLAAWLLLPASAVRMAQQVDRRHAVAALGPGRIAQLVRAEAPGLARIDLVVTSRRRPAPRTRVTLRRPGAADIVAAGTLPGRLPAPGGHEYVAVAFPALADSAGQTYEVAIERVEPRAPGTLTVWGRGAGGGLTRDGVPGEGVLAFRLWHHATGATALRHLGEHLAAGGAGAPGWAIPLGLLGAHGALLFALLRGLGRATPGEDTT